MSTSIASSDAAPDVYICDEDGLLYACCDDGRTERLDPTAHRARGVVETLEGAVRLAGGAI